jgi:hypothetical protein
MKQRWLWIIAGLALGAGLLWFSLRSVSFAEAFEHIAAADSLYLTLAVALAAAFIAIKTLRWTVLLRPIAPLRFGELHAPVYVGAALNAGVSHIGEIMRARMLQRGRKLPLASILASVGLERVLDMVAMLVLLSYLFIAGGGQFSPMLAAAARVAALLAGVAALAVIAVAMWPNRCRAILERLSARLAERRRHWIGTQFDAVAAGFRAIGSARLLVLALLGSLAQWCTIAASIWCCMRAVGVTLDTAAPVAVLVLLVIGFTLPTAPGYVGTTQVVFTLALGIFGVPAASAFAGSVLYTVFVVGPMVVVGLACLLRYFARGSTHPPHGMQNGPHREADQPGSP